MIRHVLLIAPVLSMLSVPIASAQNWSFDARQVGLGSPSGGETLASTMIDDVQEYRSIVLPFGLLQIFKDLNKVNPSSDDFDVVRTIEYAAAPIHYTFARDRGDTKADQFIVDIGNGELSRDLNVYKGFVPVNQPAAGGLASPTWGKTFRVRQGAGGAFHGIYVGAGPYVSMRVMPRFDDELIRILDSDERVYIPNTQLRINAVTQGQVALAIAGGYRGRFAWGPGVGSGSEREGLYLAANYNYLHGFRYEDVDVALRMDTDRFGLLTVNPSLPPPLIISRTNAESGRGMAIDVGVGAVVNNWEMGFGASGIANHVEWTDAVHTSYFHTDLVTGNGDLSETLPTPVGDVRVELPIEYQMYVGYDVDRWATMAEFGRGLQGQSFRAGAEYRLGSIDVRGGASYARELWNPATGVGFNMSPRVALDVALYSNSANIERKRNPAIAVSLRFTH